MKQSSPQTFRDESRLSKIGEELFAWIGAALIVGAIVLGVSAFF